MADQFGFTPETPDEFGFVPDSAKPPVTGRRMSKEDAQKYVKPLPPGYEDKPQESAISRALSGVGRGVAGLISGASSLGSPGAAVESGAQSGGEAVKALDYAKKGRGVEAAGSALSTIPGLGFIGKAAERAGGRSQMPPALETPSDAQDAAQVVKPDVAGAAGELAPTLA